MRRPLSPLLSGVQGELKLVLFNCANHGDLHLQKLLAEFIRDLCPQVQLQTIVRLLYGGFGAVASFLLSGHSCYVDKGLVLLWI